MIAAQNITEGSWSARWGNHVILLRETDGWWSAKVWFWPQDQSDKARKRLESFDGFVNAQVAIAWACGMLVAHGASVLINGHKVDLADVLSFSPAPELVE